MNNCLLLLLMSRFSSDTSKDKQDELIEFAVAPTGAHTEATSNCTSMDSLPPNKLGIM
jgi:hypothetical protein